MARTEYGIASTSRADDIEPLGRLNRQAAEARIADSRVAWPDVYLVQRTGNTWTPATETENPRPTCTEDYRSAHCGTTHQPNCAYTDPEPTTEQ
ncbi:hypothetical protein ACFYMW_35685 [Streptomyces sp. NPDC006692]|uniref:hypothetical protein n=1 Tax=unclassified Streptomyces TaxID=2593676 RepID=UPI0034392352